MHLHFFLFLPKNHLMQLDQKSLHNLRTHYNLLRVVVNADEDYNFHFYGWNIPDSHIHIVNIVNTHDIFDRFHEQHFLLSARYIFLPDWNHLLDFIMNKIFFIDSLILLREWFQNLSWDNKPIPMIQGRYEIFLEIIWIIFNKIFHFVDLWEFGGVFDCQLWVGGFIDLFELEFMGEALLENFLFLFKVLVDVFGR